MSNKETITDDGFEKRQQEIRQVWSENPWLYSWIYLIIGIVIGLLLSQQIRVQDDLVSGLWPEAVGILFTVVIIDRYNRKRAIEAEKRRLILQMGSPNTEFALEAVRLLRLEGWLQDGTLNGAKLRSANLSGADLTNAILKSVDLYGATLEGADLSNAVVTESNLKWANLYEAKLENADLRKVNLTGAVLDETDLLNADLSGSYIEVDNLNSFMDAIAFQHWTVLSITATTGRRRKDVKRLIDQGMRQFASFKKADLSSARLDQVLMPNSNFQQAFLVDASLSDADLSYTNFKAADLSSAQLQNTTLIRARLQKTVLEGADLRNVDFKDALIHAAQLETANLEGAQNLLDDQLALVGSLNGATMPSGKTYDGRYCLYYDVGDLYEYEERQDFEEMSWNYGIEVNEYRAGQDWADRNLPLQLLIWKLHSEDKQLAREAWKMIKDRHYLMDGTMQFAQLRSVNWVGKNLEGADLYGAILINANLKDARFKEAKLEEATFLGADLSGADFTDASFNKETILPDMCQWKDDSDLLRFTDRKHPDFWRSLNPASPAFQRVGGG